MILRLCLLLSLCTITVSRGEEIERMEAVVNREVSNSQFMGVVLVARENAFLLKKGYGSANLEWNIPNSPTTKFRLGSLTKQFTAACILLLEERGKLKIDDPIKNYLPDAPPAWDEITFFNLLTHTSGIPNFTGFPDFAATEATASTPETLVARFRDKTLEFEPGEKWNYSNSGYVLLGYLIERVSGESYAKFVRENLFVPLEMKDSGYDSNSEIIPGRASGYTTGADGLRHAGYIDMTIPFSAGALYSTAEDLFRWEQGLFGGKLLSAASLHKMTTPFKHSYGFGVGIVATNDGKLIAHSGGIEGFNSYLAYYPQSHVTVVVLSNVNGMAPDLIGARLGAMAVLSSEKREIILSKELLRQYVGSYELTSGVRVTMTLEGDHLNTQITGQPIYRMFASSEEQFYLKVLDVDIEFVKDAKGVVTAMIIHQGGHDSKASRVNLTVEALRAK